MQKYEEAVLTNITHLGNSTLIFKKINGSTYFVRDDKISKLSNNVWTLCDDEEEKKQTRIAIKEEIEKYHNNDDEDDEDDDTIDEMSVDEEEINQTIKKGSLGEKKFELPFSTKKMIRKYYQNIENYTDFEVNSKKYNPDVDDYENIETLIQLSKETETVFDWVIFFDFYNNLTAKRKEDKSKHKAIFDKMREKDFKYIYFQKISRKAAHIKNDFGTKFAKNIKLSRNVLNNIKTNSYKNDIIKIEKEVEEEKINEMKRQQQQLDLKNN
ncbi:hypothetical protein Glove_21g283 [Diversispora epigaea]|uniref:Uncharacterized protein n=1 Tax=Diversispora epigaea TaxID=1348612 RepID=A0A397JK98_9GLOM|nr:hypothetical protein Glove_21g283 [Diversispora epigaea]